ncbi:MAG: hypothetical protein ACYDDV_04555 [Methanoregula sp.]
MTDQTKIIDISLEKEVEERFLTELRHHISGFKEKVNEDFNEAACKAELELLHSDIYSKFSLDTNEYVLIRLLGRISISIGRRLGEIYDKIPIYCAMRRFNLSKDDISEKFKTENNKLLTGDVCIRREKLSLKDRDHFDTVVKSHFPTNNSSIGIGIEIRYIFNPNDSARLRKDDDMAKLIKESGLFPIYVVFSSISPRNEAIARLERSGWTFIIGTDAEEFIKDLLNMDLRKILENKAIEDEVKKDMENIMGSIYSSKIFIDIAKKHNKK